METLFAVVDVYIIIGLIFAVVFIGMSNLFRPPQFTAFLAQSPSHHPPSDYVYLSYVTLTTVGFGDLTPLSKMARSVVVLEALIGQIFLVTLVARLVSLYSAENRRSILGRQPSAPGRRRRSRHFNTAQDIEAAEIELAMAAEDLDAAKEELAEATNKKLDDPAT
jgi:hypothetical protein